MTKKNEYAEIIRAKIVNPGDADLLKKETQAAKLVRKTGIRDNAAARLKNCKSALKTKQANMVRFAELVSRIEASAGFAADRVSKKSSKSALKLQQDTSAGADGPNTRWTIPYSVHGLETEETCGCLGRAHTTHSYANSHIAYSVDQNAKPINSNPAEGFRFTDAICCRISKGGHRAEYNICTLLIWWRPATSAWMMELLGFSNPPKNNLYLACIREDLINVSPRSETIRNS